MFKNSYFYLGNNLRTKRIKFKTSKNIEFLSPEQSSRPGGSARKKVKVLRNQNNQRVLSALRAKSPIRSPIRALSHCDREENNKSNRKRIFKR